MSDPAALQQRLMWNGAEIQIWNNGSKFLGEPPDSVETLIDLLSREPLRPIFELYGDFVMSEPTPGHIQCWGNFEKRSHGFDIRGARLTLQPLINAIRTNQASEAYQAIKAQQHIIRIERAWWSLADVCRRPIGGQQ